MSAQRPHPGPAAGRSPPPPPGAPAPAGPGPLAVKFWGTRGSIATPGPGTRKYGGNTPCVSVRCGDTCIVFDAGTGIRNLGAALAREADARGKAVGIHIFLSHTHWDHVQGLPFFEPAYRKNTAVRIYGSTRKERFLESILHGIMNDDYFPVRMTSMAARLTIAELRRNPLRVGPLSVEWEEQVVHPGGSVRYAICGGGKRIVYSTDVELNRIYEVRQTRNTRMLAETYERFIAGADLLIADGQYTREKYADRAGWGHTSFPLLLAVAARAGVKRLAVFHHEPDFSDRLLDGFAARSRQLARRGAAPRRVFWAREGMTLTL